MAEVSGLLSNNDLLRTRLARNLDLYTRSGSVTPMGSSSFSSTSSSDPTPALSSTPSPLHLNPSTQSNPPPHPHLNPNFTLPKPTTTTSSSSHILHTHTSIPYATGDGKIDFDLLANVSGLHTTEDLIERLFNPVMTGKKDVESPFVVYDPQEAGGYHTGESGSGRGRGGGKDSKKKVVKLHSNISCDTYVKDERQTDKHIKKKNEKRRERETIIKKRS